MKLTVLKNHVPTSEVRVDTQDINESYEIFVGRSEDCHVLIDDPLISRHHFVIRNDSNGWYCDRITTLGQVLINDSPVNKTRLSNNDEIKSGPYSIFISELSAPVPAINSSFQTQATPIISVTPVSDPSETARVEKSLSDPDSELAIDTQGSAASEKIDRTGELIQEFEQENEFKEDAPQVESENLFGDPNPEDTSIDSPSEGTSLDSFANEDSGDSPSSDEGTRVFRAFVNYQLVLFGDHAPYDRFQLDLDEVFIGRDSRKCQIVLDDPEVSSIHAVIRRTNADVSIEDLNSSNGTILNGERINKSELNTGDEFVIGSTSFTLEVKSDLLDAESDRLMPVEENQFFETEEIQEEEVNLDDGEELTFNSEAPPEKSIFKRIKNDPAFRKKAIYVIAAIALCVVLFMDDESEAPAPKPQPQAKTEEAKPAENQKPQLKLSPEMEARRNQAYEFGVDSFERADYKKAQEQFGIVLEIDPNYKKVQAYNEQISLALKRIAKLEQEKREAEEKLKIKAEIEELLVKAREAVKEHQVKAAEGLFNQIVAKDPENMEVSQLKLELEAWQANEAKMALEKAAKENARKAMIDALSAGKTSYLKKEWYRAILKLEEFLRRKGTDEDLVKEASEMLADAKNQLSSDLGPLLGKARSLKEGQDLKAAYEAYLEVLKIEPTNTEALNEVDDIKSQLEARSKRIFREAIIAESLSLFNDAKEKFQEVQQISPTDSDYYKKATEKLKNYLE